MKKPNLFSFATSELSQDAFICWFLSWADEALKEDDLSLHECAVSFIHQIFSRHSVTPPEHISTLSVTRQDDYIDVLCVINNEFVIIVEDKTWTSQHSNQLANYKNKILSRGYSESNILPVYYKTEDQSNLSKVTKNGYIPLMRQDILNVLACYEGESQILRDYRFYLEEKQQRVESFKKLPVNNWHWHSWIGFYQYLQNKLQDGEWGYVSNPSGGFLGYWWWYADKDNDCAHYLQLEQDRLCFKISVGDNIDKRKARNYWHKLIVQSARELDVKLTVSKPARFGTGTCMTVCIASNQYRAVDSSGVIDLDATLRMLKDAETIIKQASETYYSSDRRASLHLQSPEHIG